MRQLGSAVTKCDTRPGLLRFGGAKKALNFLQKTLVELEATSAGLIHPGLRTGEDKRLAERTTYVLHHLELPITEGSARLQYLAIQLIDERLQTLTRDTIQPIHINKFISNFLRIAFGWTVTHANVKTIRHRIKSEKEKVANSLGP